MYSAPAYPASDDGGPLQKIILFIAIALIMLMLLLLLILDGVILWKVLDIQGDIENLTFKITVPNTGPPPFRPQG